MKPKRAARVPRKGYVKHCAIALTVITAVLSAAFAIQDTLAWLNHSDSKNNGLEIMPYIFSHQIQEEDTPFAPGTKLGGGEIILKKSWVTNDGDIPAFVRAKVFPVLAETDGPLHFEAQLGSGKQLNFVKFNGAKWMDGGDGWFYYRGVLKPGKSTEPLFEDIKLDEDAAAACEAALTITIVSEAVETRKYLAGTKYYYKEAWWDNAVGVGNRAAVALELDLLAAG